jgi:hypothetical protein
MPIQRQDARDEMTWRTMVRDANSNVVPAERIYEFPPPKTGFEGNHTVVETSIHIEPAY